MFGIPLKVTSSDYGDIITYNITNEYIDVSKLNINDQNIISGFNIGDTYEDIINNIDTSGEIKILDKSGKKLTNYDIIKTGDKIKIELSTET